MNIFNKLSDLLAVYLDTATQNLEAAKRRNTLAELYAECGKPIFEISNLYPADAEDAAAIFEEWCKGILTQCRPDIETVREYAKYTANPLQFHLWTISRTKELLKD